MTPRIPRPRPSVIEAFARLAGIAFVFAFAWICYVVASAIEAMFRVA